MSEQNDLERLADEHFPEERQEEISDTADAILQYAGNYSLGLTKDISDERLKAATHLSFMAMCIERFFRVYLRFLYNRTSNENGKHQEVLDELAESISNKLPIKIEIKIK